LFEIDGFGAFFLDFFSLFRRFTFSFATFWLYFRDALVILMRRFVYTLATLCLSFYDAFVKQNKYTKKNVKAKQRTQKNRIFAIEMLN